ncbi:Syntaxin 6 [Heracleum sosnowskyi]|uniref:Syntaxin 6 n=1 Tax=Heracleum sosnowskyi TaxID=360622 RepID=A0AAD8I939_9APIA|nr:Syntaxin 6 [Heracleum sosnowskyi]
MTSQFDRWEKDPFFLAAEEVQESADRMESTYRTWVHASKNNSRTMWNADDLKRDLQTSLGTTKWQLEEFERAVKSSYKNSTLDDAKHRHSEFIKAMEAQVSKIDSALHKSAVLAGKPPHPWVRLDEGECNELELFLTGSMASKDKKSPKDQLSPKPLEADKESPLERVKNFSDSIELALDDNVLLQGSTVARREQPPPKIPSVSGFLNTMESASKLKWQKNGNRKLKLPDRQQDVDTALLQHNNLPKGINACYERCKNCLENGDGCCDKQLYGWYGAIQRQLQRSQYHMQYRRPVQVVLWIALFFCIIVLVALRSI